MNNELIRIKCRSTYEPKVYLNDQGLWVVSQPNSDGTDIVPSYGYKSKEEAIEAWNCRADMLNAKSDGFMPI